ncbi:MAG: hypothetical protein IPG45_26050 [Deltaproteobacteria bacterium]|nr:hypothetical protein [Deltaproteobacteria bacterium]
MSDPVPVLWDVLEEHLDEAEYLFEAFDRALGAPDYNLPELAAGLESRLLAHVDGLVIGGPPVVDRLLAPTWSDEKAPRARVTVAAWVGLNLAALDPWWAGFVAASPEGARAMARALTLGDPQGLLARLPEAVGPNLAAAVWALVDRAEVQDELLPTLLRRLEPEVHAAALSLARFSSERVSSGYWERALNTPPGPIRAAGAELALVFGRLEALEVARQEPTLAGLLLQLGDRPSWDRVETLLADPIHGPSLWLSIGCAGWAAGAEVAVSQLEQADHHRVAAEAFQRITGIDWAAEGALLPPAPEAELPSLAEDLPYAALLPNVEDDLPRVDPERVRAWWKDHRGQFEPGVRYHLGRPLGDQEMQVALQSGPLRPRHLWARELLVRSHGQLAIPSSALSAAQRSALQRWPKRLELSAPYSGRR